MSWRIDRQVLISDGHRVNVVLLGEEVQREDVIFSRSHGVAEAGKWDLDQADKIMATWTDFIPDLEDEGKLLKLVDNVRRHQHREL